jgi:hypothetical protein
LKDKEKKEEKKINSEAVDIFFDGRGQIFFLNITIIGISSSKIHLAGIFILFYILFRSPFPWTVPTFSSHV